MQELLAKIAALIINPIIVLGFVVATIYFFVGVIKFISKADSDTDRKQGKEAMIWGIFGFFIMVSVSAILRFILDSFNITGVNLWFIP